MISETDYAHGAVLRHIVAAAKQPVLVGKCDSLGRLNSYSLNERIAVHVKHSSKRLPPWNFSFTLEHLRELADLRKRFPSVWIVAVCGFDGLVCIDLGEFLSVTGARPGGVASLRIDRAPRSMYRVFGNDSKLQVAKRNGIADVLSDLSTSVYIEEAT